MPNAWTILKENSSLVSGTAWEHLNNQQGGSGTVIVDGVEVNMEELNFDLEMQDELIVEIEETEEFEIEMDTEEIIVEVD